ncbi:MAG: Do family serine endopeptidase [bacterium]|nr:Do family serine endopeptidase [bacterium]
MMFYKLKSSEKWSKFRGALLAAPLVLVAGGMLVADVPNSKSESVQDPPLISAEQLGVANALSESFRAVSKQVLPAVVAIENRPSNNWRTSQPPAGNERMPQANPFKGTPFEDFFGDRFEMPSRPSPMPYQPGGIGSGVIIDSRGIILTNNHVVAGDGEVTIRLMDGREFEAKKVLTDPKSDIAVIQIESDSPLPTARMGDSDQTEIGDWVVALGQPFGLESTVTAGIVSAKNRGIGITDRENFIQTDAAINPGNSGGPLVNLRGEVVGINTAIKSSNGGNNGIGFAVPSNLAGWIKDQLLADGKVHRAYLGVNIQPVNYDLAKEFGIPPRTGVVVTDVMSGTPAEVSGLQAGDVILRFDGKAVASPQQLQLVVERSPIGKSVELEILRDGQSKILRYEGQEAPGNFGEASQDVTGTSERDATRLQSLGLEVRDLTPEVSKQLGLKGSAGVVITGVQPNSPAARAGLESGMLIEQVNRHSVTTVDEFEKQVQADDDESILLLVRSEQGSRFLVLTK